MPGARINEVCVRLFGTVTFLSYAIIILCLLLSGGGEGRGGERGGRDAFNCWIKTG